jgi:two-component system response regulator FixJ
VIDVAPRAAMAEVYVIDDDDALRHALTRLLRGADFLVRAYGSAVEFLEEAPRLSPGCVIADLRMPGIDGLELIRRIEASGLPFSTIMITGAADVRVAVEVMKAGATDFIQKPCDSDTLLATVRRALDWMVKAGDEDQAFDRFRAGLKRMTPREGDVLRGLMAGKRNKVIARDLDISPRTVELHRANLMKKMSVETLPDLVRMFVLTENRGLNPLGDTVPNAGPNFTGA